MGRKLKNKTYSIAGTTVLNGECKLRFSNTASYILDLKHKGHVDINLIQLPTSMNKIEAVNYLKTLPEFDNYEFEMLVHDFMAEDATFESMKELGYV